jgi:hypothetical protein
VSTHSTPAELSVAIRCSPHFPQVPDVMRTDFVAGRVQARIEVRSRHAWSPSSTGQTR